MSNDFGTVDRPGIVFQGPLLVWNGDERIAKVTTTAGVWPHGAYGGEVSHMFDGKSHTFWHSSKSTVQLPKTIKIEFTVSYRIKDIRALRIFFHNARIGVKKNKSPRGTRESSTK